MAPCLPSSKAIPFPMPLLAPVTRQTQPCNTLVVVGEATALSSVVDKSLHGVGAAFWVTWRCVENAVAFQTQRDKKMWVQRMVALLSFVNNVGTKGSTEVVNGATGCWLVTLSERKNSEAVRIFAVALPLVFNGSEEAILVPSGNNQSHFPLNGPLPKTSCRPGPRRIHTKSHLPPSIS